MNKNDVYQLIENHVIYGRKGRMLSNSLYNLLPDNHKSLFKVISDNWGVAAYVNAPARNVVDEEINRRLNRRRGGRPEQQVAHVADAGVELERPNIQGPGLGQGVFVRDRRGAFNVGVGGPIGIGDAVGNLDNDINWEVIQENVADRFLDDELEVDDEGF
jgi:hypothetical protein